MVCVYYCILDFKVIFLIGFVKNDIMHILEDCIVLATKTYIYAYVMEVNKLFILFNDYKCEIFNVLLTRSILMTHVQKFSIRF